MQTRCRRAERCRRRYYRDKIPGRSSHPALACWACSLATCAVGPAGTGSARAGRGRGVRATASSSASASAIMHSGQHPRPAGRERRHSKQWGRPRALVVACLEPRSLRRLRAACDSWLRCVPLRTWFLPTQLLGLSSDCLAMADARTLAARVAAKPREVLACVARARDLVRRRASLPSAYVYFVMNKPPGAPPGPRASRPSFLPSHPRAGAHPPGRRTPRRQTPAPWPPQGT